jgi:hypothetical protein
MIQELSVVQLDANQHVFAIKADIGEMNGRIHKTSWGYSFVNKEFSTNVETRLFTEGVHLITQAVLEHLENKDGYAEEMEIQRANREFDLVQHGGMR